MFSLKGLYSTNTAAYGYAKTTWVNMLTYFQPTVGHSLGCCGKG